VGGNEERRGLLMAAPLLRPQGSLIHSPLNCCAPAACAPQKAREIAHFFGPARGTGIAYKKTQRVAVQKQRRDRAQASLNIIQHQGADYA
jgi:hypothetical protein